MRFVFDLWALVVLACSRAWDALRKTRHGERP
jgi:hypothetical protein